jgi:hypothetical protein
MSRARWYISLAADLYGRARNEESPMLRAEWNYLATCYERLAEQADRSERTEITYEPMLHNSAH